VGSQAVELQQLKWVGLAAAVWLARHIMCAILVTTQAVLLAL
jgi:hypothetical protein